MSTASVAHEDHHHKETFISKYVFSMDHKMIARQFLITGIIMGCIGVFLSVLFRLQLAWPDTEFAILKMFLGSFAEDGILSPEYFWFL